MYDLTIDDRKRMTEFLGEKFRNRNFTTWDDLGVLKEKLVEKEEWKSFELYSAEMCLKDKDAYRKSLSEWLFTPTRFAWLVNKWLMLAEK